MPAIASFTLHTAGAGVVMDDVGLRGDEDFLLVHSVEDSAEYREEITHFDITGDMIYNCLKDPRLVVAYDADCLAFKGLANMHPGKAVNPALLNNHLSDAFSNGSTLWAGGTIRYRRPRRKRGAGSLASIQFELEVIPSGLSGGTGSTADAFGSTAWPDPTVTLSGSTSTTPPAAPNLYGYTIFWRRKTTLSLGTIVQTPGVGSEGAITYYLQGLSASDPQPANIAGFTTTVDPYGDAESDIIEVYHVPTATNWLHNDGSNDQVIPARLLASINPVLYTSANELYARYIAKWTITALSADAIYTYLEDYADLAAFQVANPDDGSRTLVWLFDSKINDYLLGP